MTESNSVSLTRSIKLWILWAVPLLVSLLAPDALAAPATSVVVAPVILQNVAPTTTYTGRVQAIQSVALTARIQAFVEKIDFQEGGLVKAGQTLFQLQAGPYQAALDGAQAALAKAQATEKNAELTFDRDSQLVHTNVISQSTLDSETAVRDGAAADVLSARANLETAVINFSYTTVVTPIDGRIGRATFTIGNLVGSTSGALATVVQVDPIRVVFSVADSAVVGALQKTGKSQAQLNSRVTLRLQLSNGEPYTLTGKVEFIDNQVDPQTGTVAVWGLFTNPEGLLIPGGFVTVEVRATKPEERPLVPVQSIENDASGSFVLLVDKDGRVRQQDISVGAQIGESSVVTAGLQGGEEVIVQGFQKVTAGQAVTTVQDSTLASADTGPNPTP